MTPTAQSDAEVAARYAPDGPYAYARLGLSLLIATLVGAGMWAVIVVLPKVQAEFGVDRAAASAALHVDDVRPRLRHDRARAPRRPHGHRRRR